MVSDKVKFRLSVRTSLPSNPTGGPNFHELWWAIGPPVNMFDPLSQFKKELTDALGDRLYEYQI